MRLHNLLRSLANGSVECWFLRRWRILSSNLMPVGIRVDMDILKYFSIVYYAFHV